MDSIAEVIDRIFKKGAPCSGCRRLVPCYTDPSDGKRYCMECLETAVDEAAAEIAAERQDAARLSACFQMLPPCLN